MPKNKLKAIKISKDKSTNAKVPMPKYNKIKK